MSSGIVSSGVASALSREAALTARGLVGLWVIVKVTGISRKNLTGVTAKYNSWLLKCGCHQYSKNLGLKWRWVFILTSKYQHSQLTCDWVVGAPWQRRSSARECGLFECWILTAGSQETVEAECISEMPIFIQPTKYFDECLNQITKEEGFWGEKNAVTVLECAVL